jgi:creatinine amidohydrolase/Fe(II)-dependent formamide hydrolase-like protein
MTSATAEGAQGGRRLFDGVVTSHELSRMSATQVAALTKEHALVVQPIGSVEQHGPHLPIGTDAYIAESIVHGSLQLLQDDGPDVWVLPTISYGRSVEHAGFGGTITFSTDTLFGVCRDVGRSVAASGFRRLVFVNGHGGNVAALEVVSRDIRAETGLLVFRAMLPQFGLPDDLVVPDANFGWHAGYSETCIMLALDRSLVHLDLAQSGGATAVRSLAGDKTRPRGQPVPVAWLTHDLSENGVIGDPRGASAEIGERIVASWEAQLADFYLDAARFEFSHPG